MTKVLMPRAGMPITSPADPKSNIVRSVAPAVAPKPQPGMSISPPSNRVSMNVPKSPQDQAAYTVDVQKRLAELKAPSSNAMMGPGQARVDATKMASMNQPTPPAPPGGFKKKKGGMIHKQESSKKYNAGGGVKSSASKRADGCAQRGKTKGRMI